MDQKNYNTKKYKSSSTGEPCTAAQYIAEIVCIRKKERENTGSLAFKFWNNAFKKEYQTQIRVANKLIKKFSEKALLKYLNSDKGRNVYSLGFLHKSGKFVLVTKFVEEGVEKACHQIEEEDKREKKILDSSNMQYKPKAQRSNNTLLTKLRKIENGE